MRFTIFRNRIKRDNQSINDKLHFFSSRFSIYISYFLFKIGFSANQTTFLFGFTGILSCVFFLNKSFVIGYILWRLHIIFDMADGNIARANKSFNIFAPSIDKLIHSIVNTLVYCTLIIYPIYLYNNDFDLVLSFILLPLYFIYLFFNKITSLPSEFSFDYRKYNNKSILLLSFFRNIFSQEGLIFTFVLLGHLTKNNFLNINLYFNLFSIALVFYLSTFFFGCLLKMKHLKKVLFSINKPTL